MGTLMEGAMVRPLPCQMEVARATLMEVERATLMEGEIVRRKPVPCR